MNFLQLVLKQMRQRSLSTWLTMLSVVLGVALAVAIMIVLRGSRSMFGQTEFGYDTVIGAKGSPLQLVLNTSYHLDRSPGNIPYALYETLTESPEYRRQIRWAIPFGVGDTYKGLRIVGTLPKIFGIGSDGKPLPEESTFQYRPGKTFRVAEGKPFHAEKFEAVVGADVPRRIGLDVGGRFKPTHGMPTAGAQEHVHEQEWTVVGRMAPTGTANDRVIFIPLTSFYAIAEHDEAMDAIHDVKQKTLIPAAPVMRPAPAPNPPADDHGHDHHPADHDHGQPAPQEQPPDPAEHEGHDHGDAEHDHEHHDHDAHDHEEEAQPSAAAEEPHDHDHGDQSPDEATHDHAAAEHDDHAHHDHAFHLRDDGTIELHTPKDKWLISAILLRSRAFILGETLRYTINNRDEALAVNPALVMREFFDNFLESSLTLLLMVALLVTIVAAISILVSIYNSVAARKKEIAILRALGATRQRVLALICIEAGLIGLFGGLAGFIVGHLVGAAGSTYTDRVLGQGMDWTTVGPEEWLYLAAVVVIAVLAGLVPALKAYRTPVATNLVSG